MQKFSYFFGTFFLVTALAISNVALAENMGKGPGNPGKGLAFLQALELSPEQMAKIKALRQEQHGQMLTLKEEVKKEQSELQTAVKSSASTNEALTAQFQKLQASKNKLAENRFTSMLKIREVLTPEQRAKVQEEFAKRLAGGGFRGQGKHGKMSGPAAIDDLEE